MREIKENSNKSILTEILNRKQSLNIIEMLSDCLFFMRNLVRKEIRNMKEYFEKLLKDEVKPTQSETFLFKFVGKAKELTEENLIVKN